MSKAQTIVAKRHTTLNPLLFVGIIIAIFLYCIPSFAEEVNSLDEAMEFVFSKDRVPHTSEVKLKDIHATYTEEMKVWKFIFIDGVKTHIATVDQKSRFKLESSEDKESYNEVFWTDMPRAEGIFKKDWLYEAETFIQSNKYELKSPTILSYTVCESPKGDIKSDYANGCKDDGYKETWKVVRGVEDRKLAKMVVYGDGQLDEFSNVTVELTE